ncbi:MAG: long-chain fatty acid--CoA ligase [Ilumatobacter sp.]|jgi:fatty-acyl-CoA synthase|uniref:long-chain fatty acid--CoA ligase n=1 Tax=Ilumatobacter sp. TaxID=1967498 RepID=UPI00391AB942
MQGLMQDVPLTITHLFDRAEKYFGNKEIITATGAGLERTTYAEWAQRTRRLADVLDTLGISADGRVATFAWNTARHLELYFAAPCTGRVLHTLNIRLFPEQLTYIVNHADDEVIFADQSLMGLLAPLLPTFERLRHLVIMNDGAGSVPDLDLGDVQLHDYEELLAAASPIDFPEITDERRAASMCYTSGTTGNPKGVVYTHRSTFLHTMGAMMSDSLGACEADVILPVVPMFHANAWGLAHAAVASGASLVMPGPDLSGPALAKLIVDEKVTVAAGVPTIWMAVLPELKGKDTSSLRAIPCGGSAVPKSLSEGYREQLGLPVLQAWGMTETSPIASVCHLDVDQRLLSVDEQAELRTQVGRISFGVEARVVDPETLEPIPWDGASSGELQCRGNWIAADYYDDPRSGESFTADGWLKTGDVAAVDERGRIRLVDRTKDLIKSGGEWISSVELENEIMAHPQVAEAAVIGVAHPKWGEAALACIVRAPGEEPTEDAIIEFLDGKVAKWQLPKGIVWIDEVPKTSVGKFSKKDLRSEYANALMAQ